MSKLRRSTSIRRRYISTVFIRRQNNVEKALENRRRYFDFARRTGLFGSDIDTSQKHDCMLKQYSEISGLLKHVISLTSITFKAYVQNFRLL